MKTLKKTIPIILVTCLSFFTGKLFASGSISDKDITLAVENELMFNEVSYPG
jgi:hypothetical protein